MILFLLFFPFKMYPAQTPSRGEIFSKLNICLMVFPHGPSDPVSAHERQISLEGQIVLGASSPKQNEKIKWESWVQVTELVLISDCMHAVLCKALLRLTNN